MRQSWRPLDAVSDLIAPGVATGSEKAVGGTAPIVPLGALTQDGRVEAESLLTADVDGSASRLRLRPHDVLIAARGDTPRAAVCGEAATGAFPTSNIILVRTGTELDGSFLAAWLDTPSGREGLRARLTGSTVKSLTVRSLRAMLVPVPSLDEQRRIATAWLSTRDARAAALKAAEARHGYAVAALEETILNWAGPVPEEVRS